MKRWWILGLLVVAVLAVSLYRAKLGAQENETRITALNAEIRKAVEEVSVLKAEEAYLSRPERIGPMARERLGLAPASPDQYTAPETVSKRVGEERLQLKTATPEAAATPTPIDKKKTARPAAPAAAPIEAKPQQ